MAELLDSVSIFEAQSEFVINGKQVGVCYETFAGLNPRTVRRKKSFGHCYSKVNLYYSKVILVIWNSNVMLKLSDCKMC